MSPSVNTYLGIAFFILGLASTLLMYHLWGYPYDKEKHKSSAPRWLMNTHRLMGYIYLAIYVVLMWQMVPRLWNYQIELPARTVVHLTCGITIGAILILKLSIVTMFRHLEGTLVPMLGTMLMICTILVISLSVPFSLRENYLNSQAIPDSMAGAEALLRVDKLLTEAGQGDEGFRSELASLEGLAAGRNVLNTSCTQCHDLRTVLAKPRSAKNWRATVKRMAGMSNLLNPIDEIEQWQVLAYLLAISPELKTVATASTGPSEKQTPIQNEPAPQPLSIERPAGFDSEQAQAFFEESCTQCHKLSKVENYVFANNRDVVDIIDRMVEEQEMELSDSDRKQILYYMSTTYVSSEREQAIPASTSEATEKGNAKDNTADRPANNRPSDNQVVTKPNNYSATIGKFLYENKCTQCHELDRVEEFSFANYQSVENVFGSMVVEGLKVNDKEKAFLKFFLYQKFVEK